MRTLRDTEQQRSKKRQTQHDNKKAGCMTRVILPSTQKDKTTILQCEGVRISFFRDN